MQLRLHPEAIKNFNHLAEVLISLLEPVPKPESPISTDAFSPDTYASGEVREDDIIGEIRLGMVDHTGSDVAVYFRQDDEYIGLHDEGYEQLSQLAEQMQATNVLTSRISTAFLLDAIFEWVRKKYTNTAQSSMVDYVLDKCLENIEELEFWIPIAKLYIQSEFTVGRVSFKTFTSTLIDRWCKQAKDRRKEVKPRSPREIDEAGIEEFFNKERKDLQGLAASTMKLCAERQRAFEIALEETERSLSMLRFFSAANVYPRMTSYCSVLGRENVETMKYYVLRDGKLIASSSGMVDKTVKKWEIDDDFLASLHKDGLEILSSLLLKDKKTKFEIKVVESLMLYSRSSLAKDLSDKLVYILAALESLLGGSGSIQQNLAERVAFIVGKSMEERRQIVRNVKEAYGLRSAFLHRGKAQLSDVETLKQFMGNSWQMFYNLIHHIDEFETIDELIEAIEERKLR